MRLIRVACLCAGAVAMLLAGCDATGGRLYLAANHPPEAAVPGDVRTIAVTPFVGQGPYGEVNAQMASSMLAARLNQTVGAMGSGRYTVVDRTNLKQLLMEVDLGEAGITDSASASKAGKVLNADAVIFGTVHVMKDEQRGTKSELDPMALFANNNQPKTRTVATMRRTCTVSMGFKMARPDTSAEIVSKVATHNYDSGSESTHKGLFGGKESASMDQVVHALTAQCVEDFHRMISPRVELYELQLAGGASEQAKTANALALSGDYAEAGKLYDAAFEANQSDHAALYNRGLMKLMLGDVSGGRGDIVRAGTIKSDSKYSSALLALNKALLALNKALASGQAEIRAATPGEISQQAGRDKKPKSKNDDDD